MTWRLFFETVSRFRQSRKKKGGGSNSCTDYARGISSEFLVTYTKRKGNFCLLPERNQKGLCDLRDLLKRKGEVFVPKTTSNSRFDSGKAISVLSPRRPSTDRFPRLIRGSMLIRKGVTTVVLDVLRLPVESPDRVLDALHEATPRIYIIHLTDRITLIMRGGWA